MKVDQLSAKLKCIHLVFCIDSVQFIYKTKMYVDDTILFQTCFTGQIGDDK